MKGLKAFLEILLDRYLITIAHRNNIDIETGLNMKLGIIIKLNKLSFSINKCKKTIFHNPQKSGPIQINH